MTDFGLNPQELVLLALALIVGGVITGFLAGLLGIGGGAILVPVLYEAFGIVGVDPSIRMQLVLGTVLAIIAPTSLRSFAGHYARGSVDTSVLWRLGPWVMLGVVAGVLVAKGSSSHALQIIWVVCGGLLAVKMAFGREDWRLGNGLPQSKLLEVAGGVIGFVSALMSIGGGAFMVTLLTLYGRPMLPAVATSSGFGPLIAVPGALGFIWAGWHAEGLPPFSLGYVNLLAVALVIPTSVLTAPLGVKVAHGIPRRHLELAFAAFLGVVVLRFIVSLLWSH